MPTTSESNVPGARSVVQQQVADALEDSTLPISRLLRLMWALDADQTAISHSLRAQLRARIGAPLEA